MEKFVLTPLKAYERLRKFDPEQQKIDQLLAADSKSDAIANSRASAHVKMLADAANRQQVEIARSKVFQQERLAPPPPLPPPPAPHAGDEGVPGEEAARVPPPDDPPLNESNAQEKLVLPNRDYILEKLRKVKEFKIYQDGRVRLDKFTSARSNIEEILDFMLKSRSSARKRAPVGTTIVYRALARTPNLVVNKVSLRDDVRMPLQDFIGKWRQQQHQRRRGG